MSMPPRFQYAARGSPFERAHADGEAERHREIDEEDESEDRHRLHRRLIELLRLESKICEGDERYERGRLQQLDEEIAPGRNHRDEGLRQNDPAQRLAPRHVEGDGRFPLALGYRADGAAHDLSAIGADIEPE